MSSRFARSQRRARARGRHAVLELEVCPKLGQEAVVICKIDGRSPRRELDLANAARPLPMIAAEARSTAEALGDLAQGVQRRACGLPKGSEPIAVLDTNVLLHHNRPAHVDWPAVLTAAPPLRIIIPLRVLEELDEHKWNSNDYLRHRARAVLADIDNVLGHGNTSGELKSDVVLVIAGGLGAASRSTDADADILDTCHEIEQFTGLRITLVSGDKSMRIRAAAEDLAVAEMPAKYRNRPDLG